MTKEIQQAINDIYLEYEDIPLPTDIMACTCCRNSIDITKLTTEPLIKLSENDLRDYSFSVFNTVGSSEDFLYFLPRLIELTINDNGNFTDREIIFKKLKKVDWSSLSEKKSIVLSNLINKVFESFSICKYDGYQIDSWICAISQFNNNVMSMLDILLSDTMAAEFNLIGFYEQNSKSILKKKLANPFWGRSNDNYNGILEWLLSEKVYHKVNQIYKNAY